LTTTFGEASIDEAAASNDRATLVIVNASTLTAVLRRIADANFARRWVSDARWSNVDKIVATII